MKLKKILSFFSLSLLLLPALLPPVYGKGDYTGRLDCRSFSDYSVRGLSRLFLYVLYDSVNDELYFIDTKKYFSHYDFAVSQYLTRSGPDSWIHNSIGADRRRFYQGFLADSGSYYSMSLFDDDEISPAAAETFFDKVRRGVSCKDVKFEIKSGQDGLRGSGAFRNAGKNLEFEWHSSSGAFIPVSRGVGIGKVLPFNRLPGPMKGTDESFIAVSDESEGFSEGMAGIVLKNTYSPASHVSVMARSLNVPALFLRNADSYFKPYQGKYIRLEVGADTFTVTEATRAEMTAWNESRKKNVKNKLFADLNWDRISKLDELSAADSVRCGAKAANLGQLERAAIPGVRIPEGFSLPFYYYAKYIRENGINGKISAMLADGRVSSDGTYRKKKLAEIRSEIESGRMDPGTEKEIISMWKTYLRGESVFVRSSTNAEDLRWFSGAGLYDTVPNVKTGKGIIKAVKKVWASLWNDRAFYAREAANIDHSGAFAGVFIQKSMSSDISGVMFTGFSSAETAGKTCVYISAKQGLGFRVVGAYATPEQIYKCGGKIYLSSFSEDNEMSVLAPEGGVKNRLIPRAGRRITDEGLIKSLTDAAPAIEKIFGGIPMDVEWLQAGGRLYLVQARAYRAKQK